MSKKYIIKNQTNEHIESEMKLFQDVQKKHQDTHPFWKIAHHHLQPLFAEMARRQKAAA